MNLIITCARHLEPETVEEISGILEELGDSESKISITKMSGIITVETKLEPIGVVKKIREMVLDQPWSLRYSLRIIPIQRMIETKIERIEETIEEIIGNIGEDETYRISIEKRDSNISTQDLISKIASKLKNKVSLEFPDKIILLEILGNICGISILKKSDILSTEKIKRSISE